MQHFLQELEVSSSGKGGSLTEAWWRPGLVGAVGDLVRGRSWRNGGKAADEPPIDSSSPRLEANPVTWEEVRCCCLLVVVDVIVPISVVVGVVSAGVVTSALIAKHIVCGHYSTDACNGTPGML